MMLKTQNFEHFLNYLRNNTFHGFIWMDYFSIPQSKKARDQQELAIQSLPTYFIYSTLIIVIAETFDSFYDEKVGYLSSWQGPLPSQACNVETSSHTHVW